jgi:DNA repair exonuclease SbcCD ATPase subunit
MAKSSINFQKSKGHSYDHNFRKDEPNYLLKAENRLENFYWQNERTAREIFNEELSNTKRKGGPIPRFENSHWEAVLNLNKNHTLEDVQKVARYIEQKFNITCATIAVHRDEGHYKNDKPQYNFHAHITFVTYKDGQQNWRKEKIKPADLRELQTAVAEILQMERGQENSEAERLSHRQYKQVAQEKEQVEAEILTLKERNAILEQARKDSKGKGFLKSFFDMLSSIKKSEQQYTQEQLLAEIERLKELDKQRREENERLQRQQEQQAQLAAKAAELERETTIEKLNQQIEDIKKDAEYRERETINTLIGVNNSLESVLSDERTPSHIKPLLHKEKSTTGFLASFKAMFFKSSETEKEPSLRVLLKTFVRQINQLFEAYRAALTTIKDQAEQIKTLMELDKDTAELQSKIKKLEAENTALKQQQRQQPQSNAELEETKRKLNIYIDKTKEAADFLAENVPPLKWKHIFPKRAEATLKEQVDKRIAARDKINEQMLKSSNNLMKDTAQAFEEMRELERRLQENINGEQSDEEKPRTFKAKKQ